MLTAEIHNYQAMLGAEGLRHWSATVETERGGILVRGMIHSEVFDTPGEALAWAQERLRALGEARPVVWCGRWPRRWRSQGGPKAIALRER